MILVLDIGTTVLKGALFEEDGTPLETGQRPCQMSGDGSHALYHETDALAWVRGIRAQCEEFNLSPSKRPSAIVISGNGPTLVPIGEDDRPLHPAILWMDRRSVREAADVSTATGFYVDPTFYLPKALWFYRNTPEIYAKTKYFLPCPEYITYLLTGTAATILPARGFENYIWTQSLVSKLGMDGQKFPDFVRPGEPMGRTTAEASEQLGVPKGIPVFAGAPDFVASIVGTGTVAPGRVCDRAGTSEGVNLCTEKPVTDPRLLCAEHIIDGYHNVSGIISTSGKALQWFTEIAGEKDRPFQSLFQDIASVPAGSDKLLFLPYLAGERAPLWDPNARGAFVGLTLNHGRRQMARAVVESVGFAIRDIMETMEEIGLQVEDVRITGGQAKSDAWIQIRADITGKRYLSPVMKDAELAGDLCIALTGLKRYGSLAEAAEGAVQIEQIFEPNRQQRHIYDELFSIYRDLYVGLKEPFRRMGEVE